MSSGRVALDAQKQPDRRVQKTRRALGDALMGLLLEKRYEDVTVQAIIDRADVGRSTFYAHFLDKDSLLIDAFHDLRRRHASGGGPAEDGRRAQRPHGDALGWSGEAFAWSGEMLRQYEAARGLYRSMLGSRGCALAVQETERELDTVVRTDLARVAGRRPEDVPDMVVRFVVTAFMCILSWWLDQVDAVRADEVDRVFRTLTLPGAAAALGLTIDPGPTPAALTRIALDRRPRRLI